LSICQICQKLSNLSKIVKFIKIYNLSDWQKRLGYMTRRKLTHIYLKIYKKKQLNIEGVNNTYIAACIMSIKWMQGMKKGGTEI